MKDSGYKQIDFLLGYQLGPTRILIVWHDENPIFLAFSLIGVVRRWSWEGANFKTNSLVRFLLLRALGSFFRLKSIFLILLFADEIIGRSHVQNFQFLLAKELLRSGRF
jgi:hypothetical protein